MSEEIDNEESPPLDLKEEETDSLLELASELDAKSEKPLRPEMPPPPPKKAPPPPPPAKIPSTTSETNSLPEPVSDIDAKPEPTPRVLDLHENNVEAIERLNSFVSELDGIFIRWKDEINFGGDEDISNSANSYQFSAIKLQEMKVEELSIEFNLDQHIEEPEIEFID